MQITVQIRPRRTRIIQTAVQTIIIRTDSDGDGVLDNAVDDVTDGVDDVTDDITDDVDKAADDLTEDNGPQKDTDNSDKNNPNR